MRIAAAEYTHETNSYSTIKITESLMQQCKRYPNAFLHQSTGVHSSRGGLIATANLLSITLIPTLFASFRPSGPAEKSVYEAYRREMIDALWQSHLEEPLDAIALIAHGAGIADGYDDIEGDILSHLRERFGNQIPIGICLDLHGNISQEMFAISNFMIGCKEYPHTDHFEAASKMMHLLHAQVNHHASSGKALRKLPMRIPSAAGCTLAGPGLKIKNYCKDLEERNANIFDISVFHGFNAGNVPFAGVSIVVAATTQLLADQIADQVASYVLSLEKDFIIPIHTPKEAIELAKNCDYPVVINESTDNPGSGHPGDGTILLRHFLEANIPGSVYLGIWDPEVADLASKLGVGNQINCMLGAKTDAKHGSPIPICNGVIKAISNGKFLCHSPMGLGAEINLGTTALIQVDNVKIVVTSFRSQNFDDGPLRLFGLKWQDCSIIGLKSLQHFRAWWTGKAKEIIPINAPVDKQYI